MTIYSIIINFRGGIVSPGYLKDILSLAMEAHVEQVRFGLRQQLLLDIPVKYFSEFSKGCLRQGIPISLRKDAFPNMVSSYPADGIFTNDSWLKEGIYKDVFDLFDYEPRLKINICDRSQRFVLFFTGHLNWISAPSAHFWYLHIRFPHSRNIYVWPELVYTNDIALLSRELEILLLDIHKGSIYSDIISGLALFNLIKDNDQFHYTSKSIEAPFVIPTFSLSYYEGFNKTGDHYWLGIYRRDEMFPIKFLLEVCDICLETKVGEIYTTSWKSLIIKGIDQSERHFWDYILGKYRINVRHAANELNWQIEDDKDALILKRLIIRYFDKEDVRTYGLCFAIQTRPLFNMYASIIIRRTPFKNVNQLKSLERYDILYESSFNANGTDLIMFRERVEKNHIAPYLVSLCKLYYEQESHRDQMLEHRNSTTYLEGDSVAEKLVYQCKDCLSVYDEAAGDESAGIAEGTLFSELPVEYCCSICAADLSSFIQITEGMLIYKESDY